MTRHPFHENPRTPLSPRDLLWAALNVLIAVLFVGAIPLAAAFWGEAFLARVMGR